MLRAYTPSTIRSAAQITSLDEFRRPTEDPITLSMTAAEERLRLVHYPLQSPASREVTSAIPEDVHGDVPKPIGGPNDFHLTHVVIETAFGPISYPDRSSQYLNGVYL